MFGLFQFLVPFQSIFEISLHETLSQHIKYLPKHRRGNCNELKREGEEKSKGEYWKK